MNKHFLDYHIQLHLQLLLITSVLYDLTVATIYIHKTIALIY